MKFLHLAPHPDDELIGCPAILIALQRAGHQVTNLACSLGRPEQEAQRRAELQEACQIAGFELIIPDPLPRIDSLADPAEAEGEVASLLQKIVGEYSVVVSPSIHDLHPGHEAVARAVRKVLGPETVWWQWGLWADLPVPSILYPFNKQEMETILQALQAHGGEIARNDYRQLVEGRARANSILGPERCFGFGTEGIDSSFAEVVAEVRRKDDRWIGGAPRLLDPKDPLGNTAPRDLPRAFLRGQTSEEESLLHPDLTDWIEQASITETLRAQGSGKATS